LASTPRPRPSAPSWRWARRRSPSTDLRIRPAAGSYGEEFARPVPDDELAVEADLMSTYRWPTTDGRSRRGPTGPTQELIDVILANGVDGSVVLDIGSGVGAIHLALLEAGALHPPAPVVHSLLAGENHEFVVVWSLVIASEQRRYSMISQRLTVLTEDGPQR
jgi:hypothetical protein